MHEMVRSRHFYPLLARPTRCVASFLTLCEGGGFRLIFSALSDTKKTTMNSSRQEDGDVKSESVSLTPQNVSVSPDNGSRWVLDRPDWEWRIQAPTPQVMHHDGKEAARA